MIGQVMKNSALSAKVHAMTGKALGDADYDILMNMRSVPDVASYLVENTGYASAFKSVSPTALHRGGLERLLREQLNTDIKRMLPFMSQGAKKFMTVQPLGEGIEKIKICLRLIHIGHREQIPEYMSALSGGRVVLTSAALSEIDSIDGLIEALRGTPYYKALEMFYGRAERQKLFNLEMALDTYWAGLLYKYAKKYLTKDEAKAAIRLYGTEIDLENLTFLMRCKRTFDMKDEEIYAGIIPKYYRVREATIAKIVKSESYDAALSIIAEETPYGQAFSKDDRFIEKRRDEYIAKLQRRIGSTSGYSVMSAVCYINRRRVEINNIVSVIEGIRYGLEPDMIKTYLIGYGRGGSEI